MATTPGRALQTKMLWEGGLMSRPLPTVGTEARSWIGLFSIHPEAGQALYTAYYGACNTNKDGVMIDTGDIRVCKNPINPPIPISLTFFRLPPTRPILTMKLTIASTLSLLLATAFATPAVKPAQKTNYDGAKVVRITIDDTVQQAKQVQQLVKDLDLEVWTHEASIKPLHTVDIQIDADKLVAFEEKLGGLTYITMHEDLGAAIRKESGEDTAMSRVASADGTSCNPPHPPLPQP